MTVAGAPLCEQVLTAQSADQTTHAGLFAAGYSNIRMIVVGSAGVASGAVQLEGAHTKDYAGTWQIMGAAVTVTADTVTTGGAAANIFFPYVRARISTVVAGGTVTVVIVGN